MMAFEEPGRDSSARDRRNSPLRAESLSKVAETRQALLRLVLTSPPPAEGLKCSRGYFTVCLTVALAVGCWVSFFKLQAYYGLATTSDLFQFAQLSTSWIEGRFLHDHCYGNHLAIHTYFLCPVFAAVVLPFGPPGLLLVVGLSATLNLLGLCGFLRVLRVPDFVALALATMLTIMPLSFNNYQDEVYGFHVELLLPAFAVWLAYFMVRRRWLPSIAIGVTVIAVKEDAPLLVALVALMVACEQFMRWWAGGRTGGLRQGINASAVTLIVLFDLGAGWFPVLPQTAGSHWLRNGQL